MKLFLLAPAKLNLFLEVLNRRENGYHDIATVMQSISIFDEIEIETGIGNEIYVECDIKGLSNENNLAYKAAEVYLREIGVKASVKIRIKKNIPIAGGLAGGSADAAAVLAGLNRAFEGRMCPAALMRLSASIGADVPFCLLGGTALAEGIGDKLTVCPPLPDCRILLFRMGDKESTGKMYSQLDEIREREIKSADVFLVRMSGGYLGEIISGMYNAFESVYDFPEKVVDVLNKNSDGWILSGSGPTVAVFNPSKELEGLLNNMGYTSKYASPCSGIIIKIV